MKTKLIDDGHEICGFVGSDDPVSPYMETLYLYEGKYYVLTRNRERFGDWDVRPICEEEASQFAYLHKNDDVADEEETDRLVEIYFG